MTTQRAWASYPSTFRANELKAIAKWIEAGDSGAVVGLNGAGKSNLLGFLCHRHEVFQTYLSSKAVPVVLVPVDLNNLPSTDLSAFFRVILRSFYEIRQHLAQASQEIITNLYLAHRAETDPFLSQSALRDLLFHFQVEGWRVVFVMNSFDYFSEIGTPQMFNTLRGLRDAFKDTLCYLVGTHREAIYLPEPERLGELYELLDTQVCWVGPMNEADSRHAIASLTYIASSPPEEAETLAMLALTGGYPALLKAVCHWWLAISNRPPADEWATVLLAEQGMKYRLEEIWRGLTQEEQLVLTEAQKLEIQLKASTGDKRETGESHSATKRKHQAFVNALDKLERQYPHAIAQLTTKGICQRPANETNDTDETHTDRIIFSRLLAEYIAVVAGRSRGKVWLDQETGVFYQGQNQLDIKAPKEQAILTFLVNNPRHRHTHTDLIEQAWTFDEIYEKEEGVSTERLFQIIKKLRKQIEPNSSNPCYIVNWRGEPEGGYQFFPEGRPG